MGIKVKLRPKVRSSMISTGQIDDLITGRGWSMESLLSEKPDFTSEEHRRETWARFKDRIEQAMLMHTGNPPQRHPAAFYDYESFESADLKADKLYLRRHEEGPGLPYGERAKKPA